MRGEYLKESLLVCATLLLGHISLAGSPCEQGVTWWNARNSSCLNCTICDTTNHLTVIRPCELHRDTLCVPLNQLNIQWPRKPRNRRKHDENDHASVLPASQSSKRKIVWRFSQSREEILKPWHPIRDKEETNTVHNDLEYEYDEYEDSNIKEEIVDKQSTSTMRWDIQTTTLTVATSGCLLFFLVVISLSLYHTRQWRRLRETIETDVQDIAAKLKLIECGEGQEHPPPPPTHHLYSNIHHVGKGEISRKGLNNVYTQEKHAT